MTAKRSSFIERLKRHHIFRVASLYATGAWVLILVANQVFPNIGLTRLATRNLIVGLALGFPVALALGWMLITPSNVDPRKLTSWRRLRWRLGSVLTLALVALVTVSGTYLWRVNERYLKARAPEAIGAAPTAAAISPRSIAVLPFENLSGDQDNAYFSSGTQDEILTRLAQIGSLKVISRTSTLNYASHPENVKAIGLELGVATVLEGSVQRSKDIVRVNVQLIDAGTDTHLWAETYDRNVKDIFSAESDIAAKVADRLKVALEPQEREKIASIPTRDPVAYDLYLKAGYLYNAVLDQSASGHRDMDLMKRAIGLYTRALAQDPGFALAYAYRSRVETLLFFAANGRESIDPARKDAERALALAPESSEAHLAMGYVHLQGEHDYVKALAEFERVAQDHPNDASTILAIAKVHRRLGQFPTALTELGHALELDPGNRSIYLKFISNSYEILGHYTLAEAALRQIEAQQNGDASVPALHIEVLVLSGRLSEAQALLKAIPPIEVQYSFDGYWAYNVARLERDPQAMLKAVDSITHPDSTDILNYAIMRGDAYALAGDDKDAAAAYAKAAALAGKTLASDSDDDFVYMYISRLEASRGRKAEALKAARKAVALIPISEDPINGPYDFYNLAVIEVRVGDFDSALSHLAQLMALPHGQAVSVSVLKLDPRWDPVRKDPRFLALLQRYALSED